MYLIEKTSDQFKTNFSYFADLKNPFKYPEFFYYFKNEIDANTNFHPMIMPITDIKIEMMDACNKSCLFFFELNINSFKSKYEMKKSYLDSNKNWIEEHYNEFSKKTFGLRFSN